MLLLASIKVASASRRNRDSSDKTFVEESSVKAVSGSNAALSSERSRAFDAGSVGSRVSSEGFTVAYRGSIARVYRSLASASNVEANYLILGEPEGTLDVVLGLPNPGNTTLIISKTLLESSSQDCKNASIRRLFFKSAAERKPSSSTKGLERSCVLLGGAVEALTSQLFAFGIPCNTHS